LYHSSFSRSASDLIVYLLITGCGAGGKGFGGRRGIDGICWEGKYFGY